MTRITATNFGSIAGATKGAGEMKTAGAATMPRYFPSINFIASARVVTTIVLG